MGRASGPSRSITENQLQIIDFQFARWGNVPPNQLRDDYYGGCVLTFISGDATGKSVRITKYLNSETTHRIEFVGVLDTAANGTVVPAIKMGDLFVVNGRPFNGTGAGYSTTEMNPLGGVAGKLNNVVQMKPAGSDATHLVPVALMPNYAAYQFPDPTGQRGFASFDHVSYGGQDESYDAVDYKMWRWRRYLPKSIK